VRASTPTPSRRQFLQCLSAGTVTFALPGIARAETSSKILRIGLITDVHKDIMPDADDRLRTFVNAMTAEKADALIQLGDFCVPKPANKDFLDIFNGFAGPKHHLLGNHDMDGGFKREQTVAFFGMPSRYYSFDLGGFHFIMLDSNDRPKDFKGGYPSHVAADQVAWLKEDLAKTRLPTFVFSHQSLERPTCITNQAEIRTILEAEKLPDGTRKVAACLNGHWHIDHHREINGIPYLHINSASYFWMGGKYKTERLDPELAKKFPWVSSTAPYNKALFTVLEIDPAAGEFRIRSAEDSWMGPSPADLAYQNKDLEPAWVKPAISAVQHKLS